MATTYLTRSVSSTSTPTKMTVSFWLKGGQVQSSQQTLFSIYNTANANLFWTVYFSSNGSLYLYWKDTSEVTTLGTQQKFRDTNAWYHFVYEMDTTLSTAADRIKLYINGVRVTEFEDSLGTISQSKSMDMMENTNGRITIGRGAIGGSDYYWDGLLSHFHYTDGYAYGASSFGQTDASTGQWTINTSPSVTYGTNGFFMLKDDASLSDDSGQGNNFTLGGGTIIPTQDNPSNIFAVINRLNPNAGENIAFSAGDCSIDSTGAAHRNAPCTFVLPLGNGKFYWEMKVDRMSTHVKIGITSDEWSKLNKPTPNEEFSSSNEGYTYRNDGSKENNGITSFHNSYTVGDIIGVAFDTENRKLYYAKNGTWQNSGDPTSGSTGTGAAFTITAGFNYVPAVNLYNADVSFNFGNGYFGTTAISSEGTNASGLGKFEYDVPTGYTSLCTKGLNL